MASPQEVLSFVIVMRGKIKNNNKKVREMYNRGINSSSYLNLWPAIQASFAAAATTSRSYSPEGKARRSKDGIP